MYNDDWVFDVFDDLRLWAKQAGLPILAQEIKRGKEIARWEIDAKADREATQGQTGQEAQSGNVAYYARGGIPLFVVPKTPDAP